MNRETIRRQLPSLLLTALFLLAWGLLARRMDAAYVLPLPTQVLCRIYELRKPLLLIHLPATMAVVAVSLLFSLPFGVFLAILMDQSKTVKRTLYPLLVTSQTIPTTASASFFVPWLGYDVWSKVLAAVSMTLFPIVVMLSDGFRAIPPEVAELMQTLGATRWQFFWELKLPAVLPSLFMTTRMVVPLSVIGVAIGEWLGAQAGLDCFSCRMMTQLDDAGVSAPIVLLSIAAMLLTALARQIETRTFRFRNHQDSDREGTGRRDS